MSDLGDMMAYALAVQMLKIAIVVGVASFLLGAFVFWLWGS